MYLFSETGTYLKDENIISNKGVHFNKVSPVFVTS